MYNHTIGPHAPVKPERAADCAKFVIDALCPPRYPTEHFDRLCELDPRLDRLTREIESAEAPRRMPGYWRRWQSYERRLALIIRRPCHPFLRTHYALNVAHDALRRRYWEAAAR